MKRSQLTAIALLVAVIGIGYLATKASPFAASNQEIAGAVMEVGDTFIVVAERLDIPSAQTVIVQVTPTTEIIQVPDEQRVDFIELSVGDYVTVVPSGRTVENRVEAARIEVENLIYPSQH